MSKSLDPLKETSQDLHRFWFSVSSLDQWYSIMRECRAWFGKNWQAQNKVRRKLSQQYYKPKTTDVWFEVPDPKFATWISVKYSIQVQSNNKRNSGK